MLRHTSLDLLKATSIFKAEYGGSKFQGNPESLFVPHSLLHTHIPCVNYHITIAALFLKYCAYVESLNLFPIRHLKA